MIFNSKQYVPLIYRGSRDYEALLKLLDILLTTTKYEIDTLINLYIPAECQEEFLPLLADHIGYEYNYEDTVSENRIIINNFCKMIRNRGSVLGIKLASALSLNSIEGYFGTESEGGQTNDLSDLDVFFDYETGTIIILYSNENEKVRNLLDWVRPVGMWCEFLPSSIIDHNTNAALNINADANVTVVSYDKDIFSKVDSSEIYDGIVSKQQVSGIPYTWKDCYNYTWETISQFTWEDFLSGTDISQSITVTFDGNGGTFSVPSIITTYQGFTITTISSSNVTRGIDKLEKWIDVTSGREYDPDTEILIESATNITLRASWKVLQQQKFIIDLDENYTSTIGEITSMFYYTPWHILIEHQNTGSTVWTIDSIINSTPNRPGDIHYVDYNNPYDSGKLRISVGYDYTDQIENPVCFEFFSALNDLFNDATIIDFSPLNEITYDIFEQAPNLLTILSWRNIVETFILPPNITQLTIPYQGMLASRCPKLNSIIFPEVPCQIICQLTTDVITPYLPLLSYVGTQNVNQNTFAVPSNITILYKDYNQFISSGNYDYLSFISNSVIAKTINIACVMATDDSNNPIPNIGIDLANTSEYYVENVNLSGIYNLGSITINSKPLNNLYIGTQCSINDYAGLTDLSRVTNDNLVVDTDSYGATQRLGNYAISGGNVENVSLGIAINQIGEWSLTSLPNVEMLEIPQNITTIPKTALQNNNSLNNLQFNNSNGTLVLQGCHTLTALQDITIPSSYDVNTCFYGCTNLRTIIISDINNFDAETSFVNCINISEIINNSTVFRVIDNILYNSNSTYLTWVPWSKNIVIVPNGVQDIGLYSFSGCERMKLAPYVVNGNSIITSDIIHYYNEVVLPESVRNIYANAFNLTNITLLRILNPNLDLTNLTNCDITEIQGYINSTAHIYANSHNILFTPIDDMTNNINGNVTDIIGSNIL